MTLALVPITEPKPLADLAQQWMDCKAAEQSANAARKAIEDQMLALIDKKDEGTVTALAGMFKVKVAYKLTRKFDTDMVKERWEELNDYQQSAFRWKVEPDTVELKALENMRPEDYAGLSPFLTVKPASPSFSVEAV